MIKKCLSLLLLIVVALNIHAQQDPVHVKFEVKKLADKSYELHIVTAIDAPWHIYSQIQPKEAIAAPTEISFTKNPLIIINGKAAEIGKKEKYEDKNLGIIQYQYSDKLEFVQKFSLKAAVKTNLRGSITYIACNDTRCLPDKTVEFDIPVL
jgi:hypothetical protein